MIMDIEKKTSKIIEHAMHYGASDIHVVPLEKAGVIRFRVDGRLVDMETLPGKFMNRVISHLKFVSGMDIGERRRPQNQALERTINHKKVFMRLSTFPSSKTESLVIRLFPLESENELLQLSLFPSQANEIHQLMEVRQGLVIVCGPTGTGKTTTLYSLLTSRVNELHENIITLEDPVERHQSKFLQMEINEKAGITYASGLRSLLRHDPDLLMIGEVRDPETAKMAIRASLSGHLVLTTLHSGSSIGALKRLLDLGVSYMDLEEVLQGIIAQRLVDKMCPFCGEECQLFCRKKRKQRRGAIYEILAGEELTTAISQLSKGRDVKPPRKTIHHWLKKGISLGYLPESEWKRLGKGGI